jgi:predicted Zn-dependent protease
VSKDGIDRLAEQVVATARLAPENPEYTSPSGPQHYAAIAGAYDSATAEFDPRLRVHAAQPAIESARGAGLVAAGFHSESVEEITRLASTGASGAHRITRAELSVTIRTPDGTSSGWASAAAIAAGRLDAAGVAKRALDRALAWKNPAELPPGPYTVVLDAPALADLWFGFGGLDARSAEEGRSAFARPGGGTLVGEKLFADTVTLASDPADALAPGLPWGEDGFASERVTFVEKGVLKGLRRSRYWAQKTGTKPTIIGGSYQLAGTAASLDDLIAGCERGLLVTHIWYVRMLDPRRLTVTGLTRDATLLIEKGHVTGAVKNFRFNQSLIELFANVEAAGRSERTLDGSALPCLRVHDFHMSSISDAV